MAARCRAGSGATMRRARLTGRRDLPELPVSGCGSVGGVFARAGRAARRRRRQPESANHAVQLCRSGGLAVGRVENVTVPAGSFSAFKVTAQVDITTMMPHWPLLHSASSSGPRFRRTRSTLRRRRPFGCSSRKGPPLLAAPKSRRNLSATILLGAAGLAGRCRARRFADRQALASS